MKKLLAFLLLAGWAGLAHAVQPVLNETYPNGGQRGSELTVEFRGERLDDTKEIIFYSPGFEVVKFESVTNKIVKARIKIASDCRLGEHGVRVRTAGGVSEFRTFFVSPFPNVEEKEPNDDLAKAQPIPLNSTVEGVIQREDVDYFKIEAKKGQRISVEVEGIRLGHTMFDPYVAILNPNGSKLVESDDTALFLQDPATSAVIPKDGSYFVQVRETTYGGNEKSNYRLHVGTFPRPLAVYPAGGKAGETVQVKFIGDAAGDFTQEVKLPGAPDEKFGIAPVQAGESAPSLMKFRVSAFPNVFEVEPNNELKQATQTSLEPPLAFNGIIGETGDVDWFRFKAKKDQVFQVEVYASRIGSPLDSVLTVCDANGRTLQSNDDAAGSDSSLRVTIPADGEYLVKVTDQLGHGGPTYTYRVELTKPEASVVFNIPEVARADTQSRQMMVIPRGNRFTTMMNVKRVDFRGDLDFYVKDLPPGVKLKADRVPGSMTLVALVFEAAADAPLGGKLVDLNGRWIETSKDGKTTTEHELPGGLRQMHDLVISNPNTTVYYQTEVRQLAVAVVEEAPFSVRIVEPKVPIARDGTMDLQIVAERKAGFDGPIDVYLPFRPPGIGATSRVTIEKGKTTATYPISANGNAELRAWQVVALAGATDKGGMIWVSSDLTKLEVVTQFVSGKLDIVTVEQGKPTKMVCKLEQQTPFEGNATVQLLGLPASTTAADKTITKDDKEVTFDVMTTAKSPAGLQKRIFCNVIISKNSETITHTVATGGVLRIDAPKAKLAEAGKDEKLAANQPAATTPAKKKSAK